MIKVLHTLVHNREFGSIVTLMQNLKYNRDL